MNAIGIDLGTSNSVVAVYRRGRTETLAIDGRNLVPSCVALKPGGGLLVGTQAKTRSLVEPTQSVLAIKRQMGDREYRVELGGKAYSPVDISSMILKKLVDGARERLGEPIKDVVISVPAYFTNNQKEDTRLAGEKAGINVLSLVPEPTAAAIAYGINQGRDQTIMVFDLGGGTFDISILQIKQNNFEVKAIGGCHLLGGEDFDRRLIDLLLARMRAARQLPPSMSPAETLQLSVKLKETAEAAKKELSASETAEVQVPVGNSTAVLKITRAEYEAVIADLVDRTITITMDSLKQANLRPDDVDRIVLVGGSTRIPLISRTLAARICEPYIADNVDEVVAHGAAILAANLSSIKEADLAPIEVTNITPHSLGIRADKDKFAVLIPRGTQLPVELTKTFTTAFDNADRTDVVIFQGEEPLCSNNLQIGGVGLTGLARAKAGVPKIDVTFSLDRDDILKVAAVDRSSSSRGEVTIERFVPRPYEAALEKQAPDLTTLRFGASHVGCDDAAGVLKKLRLKCDLLEHKDFRRITSLKKYDVAFINCMAGMYGGLDSLDANANAGALREFVSEGGVLYVSDLALLNITFAFPDVVNFGFNGKEGQATATVVDPELKAQVGTTCPIFFDFDYATVEGVSSNCRVYLTLGKAPLLLSFPHGKGHVVYTSFHHGKQLGEQSTKLLSYMIMQTIALATNTPLIEVADGMEKKRAIR